MDLAIIPDKASKYTRQQMAEAAFHYFCEGNIARVSEITGIPDRTIYEWRAQDWWDKAIAAACEENRDEIDAFAGRIIFAAMAGAMDRIENGDYKPTKTGELVRVPMSGRDLTWTGAVWFDKQRILRGLATSISSSSGDGLAQRLKELEDKANAKVITN